jgi:hypothetical protein
LQIRDQLEALSNAGHIGARFDDEFTVNFEAIARRNLGRDRRNSYGRRESSFIPRDVPESVE